MMDHRDLVAHHAGVRGLNQVWDVFDKHSWVARVWLCDWYQTVSLYLIVNDPDLYGFKTLSGYDEWNRWLKTHNFPKPRGMGSPPRSWEPAPWG